MSLYLKEVIAASRDWKIFLDISVEYITENWPEILQNKSKQDFKKDYEKEILKF